ncbi:thiamine-phosphate kinase [Psychromonas sp.]|nr:thiamine-phosphate kinase [Psychromonas sp.]
MSKSEFDIIKRYFQRANNAADGVIIGIGDDCAILDIPVGQQLAVTTDSLVCGVHFFEDVDAYRLGYKSLAVNLSDLAAMGATAKWVSLAITLPEIDEPWLAEFCRGFFTLADKYNVQLVGGDTTKGPLSITVSAKGLVPSGKALTRYNAKNNDIICVSGPLGDGAVGLALKLEELSLTNRQPFIDALEFTEPRLLLGSQLINYASSCIDISDGLSQDLSHILKQSQCHADIHLETLPLSDALKKQIELKNLSLLQAWQFAVTGGDDYELLFTIPREKLTQLKENLRVIGLTCFEIGTIKVLDDVSAIDSKKSLIPSITFTHLQQPIDLNIDGWDHFK